MKWVVILIIISGLFPTHLMSAEFEKQSSISRKKFSFYFPYSEIQQADRINAIKLKKEWRPRGWTDRVPFGVAIDKRQNRAYFLVYESFFKKNIVPISGKFDSLSDIAVNSDGVLAVADRGANLVLLYRFQFPNVTPIGQVSVQSPRRVEFGYDNMLVVASHNRIHMFHVKSSGEVKAKPKISQKVAKELNQRAIVDVSLNRRQELFVLTDRELKRFGENGLLLGSLRLKTPYIAVENSVYGDVFLLQKNQAIVDKWTRDFQPLTSLNFESDLSMTPVDFTIYDSHGYLAISALEKGVYYGMGTAITKPRVESLPDGGYHVRFNISMPSFVTVTLNRDDELGDRVIVEKRRLMAGQHSLYWDGRHYEKPIVAGKIRIDAKATYSLANTDTEFVSF